MNITTLSGFWLVLYQIVVWVSLVGSLVFPLWYGFTRPWYKSVMGKHVMAFSSVVALAMTVLALRPFLDPDTRFILSIVLIAALGGCCWQRAWIFFRVRKTDEHE